jgi:poly-gamma-glutamate capsule biosynthesis protein CapA/YwtB (metallophosphatase superfamily)
MRPGSALLGLLACALAGLLPCLQEAHAGDVLRVALAGDVMFGRWLGGRYRPYVSALPAAMVQRLRAADLSVVNLETGLCSEQSARAHAAEAAAQHHRLTAPVQRLMELERAGVDVAVLANNHALDCGAAGLVHTERALARRGISALGGQAHERHSPRPLRLRRSGFDIVMLAATQHRVPVATHGPAPRTIAGDHAEFVAEVRTLRAREPSALLIVSLHWGKEHAAHPAPHQRLFARELIDAGASVVHGHGAHVLQDIERHDQGLIVYNAGNLHFDMKAPSTLVELTLERMNGAPRVQTFATVSEP